MEENLRPNGNKKTKTKKFLHPNHSPINEVTSHKKRDYTKSDLNCYECETPDDLKRKRDPRREQENES